MNKKILLIIATALLAIVVAGYALSIPLLDITQAQPAKTKQITLQIPPDKRSAHNKTLFLNESAGQWVFTITDLTGTVKFAKIIFYKKDRPHEVFTWSRLNPSVGDSITVNLTAGTYVLHIIIAGKPNSSITLTVAYP